MRNRYAQLCLHMVRDIVDPPAALRVRGRAVHPRVPGAAITLGRIQSLRQADLNLGAANRLSLLIDDAAAGANAWFQSHRVLAREFLAAGELALLPVGKYRGE